MTRVCTRVQLHDPTTLSLVLVFIRLSLAEYPVLMLVPESQLSLSEQLLKLEPSVTAAPPLLLGRLDSRMLLLDDAFLSKNNDSSERLAAEMQQRKRDEGAKTTTSQRRRRRQSRRNMAVRGVLTGRPMAFTLCVSPLRQV